MIYGYLRVSTDIQDTESQLDGINKYCENKSIKIDSWIKDDGVSGAVDFEDRNLGKLIKKAKNGDTIIAGEVSRLGRSLFMVMRFLEYCMKNEIKVITVKDGYELCDNIQSKVLAFAFGLSAEIEREMIKRRTSEGRARFVAAGGKLGSSSNYGNLKLSKFDKEIRSMCKEGKSMSYIARCFGTSRDTVSRYIKYCNIEFSEKESSLMKQNNKNHSVTEKKLEECRTVIEYAINKGYTFQEIYNHVKSCKNIAIAEKSIRYYIRSDKYLNDLWVKKREKLRLEANIKASKKTNKINEYKNQLNGEYL